MYIAPFHLHYVRISSVLTMLNIEICCVNLIRDPNLASSLHRLANTISCTVSNCSAGHGQPCTVNLFGTSAAGKIKRDRVRNSYENKVSAPLRVRDHQVLDRLAAPFCLRPVSYPPPSPTDPLTPPPRHHTPKTPPTMPSVNMIQKTDRAKMAIAMVSLDLVHAFDQVKAMSLCEYSSP